eukprot:TRINITY_DN20669_c0_g1_i1.p2 TRINITY_DN20669_c0_g1~~TRINITY_DN20669_c0_g1_i1.p2  ORF type:complete len:192 (-),score=14.48 TRINITY_DN20669_c0_g1_i1:12-587(-)
MDGDICASRYLRLPANVLELVLRDNNIPLYVGKERKNFGGQKLTKAPICESYCITPEGNVQLCCAYPSSIGNLKNEPFSSLLKHSKELAWWHNITLNDYEKCGKFDYCDYCKPCPGVNFAETGSPLKPAITNCNIAKIRYELSLKLKQGYDPLNGKSVQKCLSLISIPLLDLKREYGENFRNKRLTEIGQM